MQDIGLQAGHQPNPFTQSDSHSLLPARRLAAQGGFWHHRRLVQQARQILQNLILKRIGKNLQGHGKHVGPL